MIATDQFAQLQELWQTITRSDILQHRSLAGVIQQFLLHKIGIGKPPVGLNGNAPLTRLLSNYLQGKEIKIPYRFDVVKLKTSDIVNDIIRRDDNNINE